MKLLPLARFLPKPPGQKGKIYRNAWNFLVVFSRIALWSLKVLEKSKCTCKHELGYNMHLSDSLDFLFE